MHDYRNALMAACEHHRDAHAHLAADAADQQASHDAADARILKMLEQSGHLKPKAT